MKKTILLLLTNLLIGITACAQNVFSYQNQSYTTGTHTWFVTPDAAEKMKEQYVFSSVREALMAADSLQRLLPLGTFHKKKPLTIYIAPHVYWIDDPDDNAVRTPLPGEGIPYGMKLEVSHLRLVGISSNPEHTVLASNRGQTQGAFGNFTMFHFKGNDIMLENLTLGNYCNVDLVYPLNPSLNRKKRADAIVQAQLAICQGDRMAARNCRFISRLNLCPMVGPHRTYFENCYFECTDDALCGTGIHLNCRFTLFSSKPFYSTSGTGAVFLNCDFYSHTQGKQYLVKVGSPVTMIDCRWQCDDPNLIINWTQNPTDDQRSYQYNVSQDGRDILIHKDQPQLTVDMSDKPLLEAFRLNLPKRLFSAGTEGDTIVYNLYNLTCGSDGWNPAQQPEFIKQYANRGVGLTLNHRHCIIETGKDTLHLQAARQGFMEKPDFSRSIKDIRWRIEGDNPTAIHVEEQNDGSLIITGMNQGEETERLSLIATDSNGLEAACILSIRPSTLPSPTFIQSPVMTIHSDSITLDYLLDLQGRADQSVITWYRSPSPNGYPRKAIATSRMNTPLRTYPLTAADNGYYICASIRPKHLRSTPGKTNIIVSPTPIQIMKKQISQIRTTFINFPTELQPDILPGHWTVDAFKPHDTETYDWTVDSSKPAWHYGHGVDGAANAYGLIQSIKGARLLYTPIEGKYNNMNITWKVAPCKTAGQGFGSATGQYMDIYIKMDTKTLTGYALRIIRTPKNDRAVDFQLMKYHHGNVTPLSEAVSSICYRNGCTIQLSVKGDTLTAIAYNENQLPASHNPDLTTDVCLKAVIEFNHFGGIGIQHTGSTGASATVLKELEINYE